MALGLSALSLPQWQERIGKDRTAVQRHPKHPAAGFALQHATRASEPHHWVLYLGRYQGSPPETPGVKTQTNLQAILTAHLDACESMPLFGMRHCTALHCKLAPGPTVRPVRHAALRCARMRPRPALVSKSWPERAQTLIIALSPDVGVLALNVIKIQRKLTMPRCRVQPPVSRS